MREVSRHGVAPVVLSAVAAGLAGGSLLGLPTGAGARASVRMGVGARIADGVNLGQVERGNFRSLGGKWTEVAYAVNPQNGTGEQWTAGAPTPADTLAVRPGRLIFDQSDPTVITHARLIAPEADDGSRDLPLRWQLGHGVVTASLVNQNVAINYSLSVYSKDPAIQTNNGVELQHRPTIALWSSNDGYMLVFQRITPLQKCGTVHTTSGNGSYVYRATVTGRDVNCVTARSVAVRSLSGKGDPSGWSCLAGDDTGRCTRGDQEVDYVVLNNVSGDVKRR